MSESLRDLESGPGQPGAVASLEAPVGKAATVMHQESSRSTAVGSLYPVVWRWHFYAGLILAPLLWVVTITGALYVFRTELTAWRDRELLVVEPRSQRLSFDELQAIAVRELGTDKVDAIVAHPEPDRSVRFVADVEGSGGPAEHRHRHLYLDPYTGKVLGTRIDDEDFFAVTLELHRSLLMGVTGRILTELATSWGLVLMATGLFLWWPRGKKNVGVWSPRIQGKPYAVLRDWHAVAGAYFVPLTALVAGTGLFFTLVWGTGFNTATKKAGHWAPQWFDTPKVSRPNSAARPVSLERTVATVLAQSRPGDAAMIRLADAPDLAHKAFLMRDEDKNSLRMVTVNPYTAEPIAVVDPPDLPLLYRVRLWAVSIHMGQIFGTPTKVLALLASLALFGLSVTGTWMWWQRRPRGRTGFPRRPPPRSLPGWGWGLMIATGILLPVAGASMIVVTVLDLVAAPLRRRGE